MKKTPSQRPERQGATHLLEVGKPYGPSAGHGQRERTITSGPAELLAIQHRKTVSAVATEILDRNLPRLRFE